MDSYAGASPDLYLVAIGVVIWVVAASVAFGFYIPVLRNHRQAERAPFAPLRETSWRSMATEPPRPQPFGPAPADGAASAKPISNAVSDPLTPVR